MNLEILSNNLFIYWSVENIITDTIKIISLFIFGLEFKDFLFVCLFVCLICFLLFLFCSIIDDVSNVSLLFKMAIICTDTIKVA